MQLLATDVLYLLPVAMQILLPVFLESLQKVSRRLVPRVLVLASDAQGLQICRTKHAHCLPWFQRLSAA